MLPTKGVHAFTNDIDSHQPARTVQASLGQNSFQKSMEKVTQCICRHNPVAG